MCAHTFQVSTLFVPPHPAGSHARPRFHPTRFAKRRKISREKERKKKVGTAVRTTSETVLRSGSAGKILGELIGVRRLKIIIKKKRMWLKHFNLQNIENNSV